MYSSRLSWLRALLLAGCITSMGAIFFATLPSVVAAEITPLESMDIVRNAERIESIRQRVTAVEEQNVRTLIQAQAIVAQQSEMKAQLAEMSWMLRGLIVGLAGLMVEALSRFWLARKG